MKKIKDHQIWLRILMLLFISSQISSAEAHTRPATPSKFGLQDEVSSSPFSEHNLNTSTSPEPSIKTWRLVRSPSDSSEMITLRESDEAEGRYIIIDGGNTDTIGISEFLIYFGAVALAIVCALALLGILLAILDGINATPAAGPTTYSYGGTPAVADSYSSYQRAFDVSKALEQNYQKYGDVLHPTL